MKLNGDWLYDQLKEALSVLELGWGDKGALTITFESGLLTFEGNRRVYQIPADEDIRNEVTTSPETQLLRDLNIIRPGQPGCGDFSREQRTWADLAKYIATSNSN